MRTPAAGKKPPPGAKRTGDLSDDSGDVARPTPIPRPAASDDEKDQGGGARGGATSDSSSSEREKDGGGAYIQVSHFAVKSTS